MFSNIILAIKNKIINWLILLRAIIFSQQLFLFVPVLVAIGILLFFNCNNCIANPYQYLYQSLILIFTASILLFIYRDSYIGKFYLASIIILSAFLWSLIYESFLFKRNLVNQKLYGNIIAKIVDLKISQNSTNHNSKGALSLERVVFYKISADHYQMLQAQKNALQNAEKLRKKKIEKEIRKKKQKAKQFQKKQEKSILDQKKKNYKYQELTSFLLENGLDDSEIKALEPENEFKILKLTKNLSKKIIACNKDKSCVDKVIRLQIKNNKIKKIKKIIFNKKVEILQMADSEAIKKLQLEIKVLNQEIFELQWQYQIPQKFLKIINKCQMQQSEIESSVANINNCELIAKEQFFLQQVQKLEKNNENIESKTEIAELNNGEGEEESKNKKDNKQDNNFAMPKMNQKFYQQAIKCGKDIECLQGVKEDFLNIKNYQNQIKNKKKQEREELRKIKLQKQKLAKVAKKKIKAQEKMLNSQQYQDFDRKFIDLKNAYYPLKYRQINIKNYDGEIAGFLSNNFIDHLSVNGPRKIRVATNFDLAGLNIGDIVSLRVYLQQSSGKRFFGDFNYYQDSIIKGFEGSGYGFGEVKIIKKSDNKIINQSWITKLRYKILDNILQNIKNQDQAKIAGALLVGTQNLIPQELMNNIQNSGLIHLLSISGLHLTIAGLIFFITSRFLLSLNENLTLYYDIKKISAIFAIIGCFCYLKLAGSPIPAIRSFYFSLLIMLAILLDKSANPMRSIAISFCVIVLSKPISIFSASLQLSFSAIIAITATHQIFEKIKPLNLQSSFIKKFLWYFMQIIFSSIVAQLATMPFSIYHFNNFANFSILSNLLAIPITSFITMPFGFLSLLLMPLQTGLEKFTLQIMGLSIAVIVDIAKFVANLKYSQLIVYDFSSFVFVGAVLSLLFFCIINHKIRYFILIIFLFFILRISFTKEPLISIDGEQKFFTLHHQEKGLIFSKQPIGSKLDLWYRYGLQNWKNRKISTIENLSEPEKESLGIDCNTKNCLIDMAKFSKFNLQDNLKNRYFLILLTRNSNQEICNLKADILINLTKKYALPNCVIANFRQVVDNLDFLPKNFLSLTL
ncbi:MAG: ComEC/Rec2 family competence protein [Rickettsiales bacterium]|nr:ComEC/Rec2 family competence protein [Rickettsiales bacterium]